MGMLESIFLVFLYLAVCYYMSDYEESMPLPIPIKKIQRFKREIRHSAYYPFVLIVFSFLTIGSILFLWFLWNIMRAYPVIFIFYQAGIIELPILLLALGIAFIGFAGAWYNFVIAFEHLCKNINVLYRYLCMRNKKVRIVVRWLKDA